MQVLVYVATTVKCGTYSQFVFTTKSSFTLSESLHSTRHIKPWCGTMQYDANICHVINVYKPAIF